VDSSSPRLHKEEPDTVKTFVTGVAKAIVWAQAHTTSQVIAQYTKWLNAHAVPVTRRRSNSGSLTAYRKKVASSVQRTSASSPRGWCEQEASSRTRSRSLMRTQQVQPVRVVMSIKIQIRSVSRQFEVRPSSATSVREPSSPHSTALTSTFGPASFLCSSAERMRKVDTPGSVGGLEVPTTGEILFDGLPVTGPDSTAPLSFSSTRCSRGAPLAAMLSLDSRPRRRVASRSPNERRKPGSICRSSDSMVSKISTA